MEDVEAQMEDLETKKAAKQEARKETEEPLCRDAR